jgi:hypothetical protein
MRRERPSSGLVHSILAHSILVHSILVISLVDRGSAITIPAGHIRRTHLVCGPQAQTHAFTQKDENDRPEAHPFEEEHCL